MIFKHNSGLIKLRSILIITPFLTQTTPAMFRIRSFINEMKKEYQLHIINTSVSGTSHNVSFYKINENYSNQLDKKTKIRENPLFRSFILPFFYIGWILSCLLKGSKIIENKNIDIIFVSHGPPHVLVIGYLLKITYRKCKLVTDYRDSWTDNPYRTYPSKIIRRILKNIEADILNNSDLIIVVSEVEKKRFLLNYRNIEDKIALIRNGFFNYKQTKKSERDYFKITHSGSFYKKKQPDIILNAYKRFLERINFEKVRFFFVGSLDRENIERARKMGIENNLVFTGNISYKQAYLNIVDSDLLLFYEPTLAMTTKIYDYVSSGHPILSITQNTEVIKFINKYSPYSIIVTEYDEKLISNKMNEFYNKWKRNVIYDFKLKSKFIKKYSRKNIAKKLVSTINSLYG